MHASISGHTVLKATITMPRNGLWTADLEADSDIPLSGPVTLSLGDGVLDLHGAVVVGDISHGRWHARMLGGQGGLGHTVAAKPYRGAPLRLVLIDLLGEVGERLSATVTDGIWLSTVPAFWTRVYGPATSALNDLCSAVGASWRALPDGTIWAGLETFPAHAGAVEVINEYPRERLLEAVTEGSIILPGESVNARPVGTVRHVLDKAKFRSWVSFED